MKVATLEELQQKDKKEVQRELTFPVKLPSAGRHGYPDVIMCRPLKVRDVKGLVRAVGDISGELEYLDKLVAVIQDTVVEPAGFNLAEVSLQDFLKILLAHRVNSVGSFLDLGVDCEKCGKRGQVAKIDLTELEEKVLGDDYGVDPVKVGKYLVRYPRLGVFLGKKGNLDSVTDFDLVDDMLRVTSGVSVDDLDLKEYREVLDWLRKWYGSYGVQTSVKVKCSGCREEVEVGIPFLFFLFTG